MPRVVAVIGASSDRSKFGNKAVRAFLHHGDQVVPINPREPEVEGLKAYASVLDVPGPVDLATFYVAPRVGLGLLEDVVKKGIPEAWFNPGADSREVVERARALGLRTVVTCSIIRIGESPAMY
jgi:acyl-CoA synthetase (NDP forming)